MELKPVFEDQPEPQRRRRRRRRSGSSEDADRPVMQDEEGRRHEAHSDASLPEDDDDDDSKPDAAEVQGPAWQGIVFALVPLLIILFGTGRDVWSLSLAAALLGLVMILFPPQRRLPRLVLTCLGAALLAPLLAYLPYRMHGGMPFRESLAADWGLQLDHFITPQPWVTFEAWARLSLQLVWLAWCLARGFSSDQRRTALSTLAIGGVLLCWLSIVVKMGWLAVPWWVFEDVEKIVHFGPFANRNQLSSLAAITCVLCAASAYESQRRKSRMWLLYAAGFFLPVTAIFMNSSRAGLLLLFFGMTLWLGTASMRRGFFRKMALTASFILLGIALMFVASGGLSNRLLTESFGEFGSSMRMQFVRESLNIISHAPWIGMGLGNFETLFPLYADSFDPRFHSLHPENDLLWLLVEGGLSTVVPCLILVVWILRSTGPWISKKSRSRGHRHDRRARNTAAIALSLGLLHGLVDVPNHGLGYFSLSALLAGIALRPRRLPNAAGWPEKTVAVAAGAVALALAAAWGMVSSGKPVLPGSSAARMLRGRAAELAETGSVADAHTLLSEALRLRPMDYMLYHWRGQISLQRLDTSAALRDFSLSRVLEPHAAYFCYAEGVDWLDVQPEYAVIGWREFLRRAASAGSGAHGYYRQMLSYSQMHPEIRQPVWELAKGNLELQMHYIQTVQTREDFERCLRDILSRQPDLAGIDAVQRMNLFTLWQRLGDPEALFASIAANKIWERDGGWKLLAEHHASKSEFEAACRLAEVYLPSLHRATPGGTTDVQALERAFLFNPMDPQNGINLFQAYKNRSEYDQAIRTLEKVRNSSSPPNYIDQEIASLYMAKKDFRRAWEHYSKAAAATK